MSNDSWDKHISWFPENYLRTFPGEIWEIINEINENRICISTTVTRFIEN